MKKTIIVTLLFLLGISITPAQATPEGYTSIKNAEELKSKIEQNKYGKYFLENDIDLSDYANWNPLRFNGTLDGNNKTIYGLRVIRESSDDAQGFFSQLHDATIKNLIIDDGLVVGKTFVGGLAGYVQRSKIINVHSKITVKAKNHSPGSLIGMARATIIKNCSATGNSTGDSHAGGLIGDATDTKIKASYSTGNVTGRHFTGGLVGNGENATVQNSFSTSKVDSTSVATNGSLMGKGKYIVVKNSYAIGTSSSRKLIGKLDEYSVVKDSYYQFVKPIKWDFTKIWAKSLKGDFCLRGLIDPYTGAICQEN